ncbi:MAG TPA: DUF2461 domain-containing protein [Flavobacteriales bacterium]
MAWFTPDYNRFFKELAAHNNKEWFDANRTRYEATVKAPMQAFVGELIQRIRKVDPQVTMEPKQAIHRINRDIRFSKDKMPYKTYSSAIIQRGEKKDMTTPGMYIELGPENVWIYGGAYLPEKEQLYDIRDAMLKDGKAFRKAIAGKDFVKFFGSVQGEKNKVLPPEFKGAVAQEPLIANKQFYVAAKLPPKTVTADDLAETVMAHYKAMKPMNDWLAKAMQG